MSPGSPPVTAIIPDGNRRWARLRAASLVEAYSRAVEQLHLALDYLLWVVGSPAVYVYSSSLENCVYRRGVEAKAIERVASTIGLKMLERLESEGVNVYFYGCSGAAPPSIAGFARDRLLAAAPRLPAVIVLVCYSILAEARLGKLIGVDPLAPSVDLLYRSGGEKRLSGFPPALVSYAELFFDDEYWPESGASGVARAVEWYRGRERRFGK